MDHKLDILTYALIGVATLTSIFILVGALIFFVRALA
jgi:hypothetical protein